MIIKFPQDIELTPAELVQAGVCGVLRRVASIQRGYNKNKHAIRSDWATDIDGAASELGVAKCRGVYWSAHVNNLRGDDLPCGVQVRSTDHQNGHLILRDNDDPKKFFFLVVSRTPIYSIRGWIAGSSGMVDEFRRSGANGEADCWWIPQSALITEWKDDA